MLVEITDKGIKTETFEETRNSIITAIQNKISDFSIDEKDMMYQFLSIFSETLQNPANALVAEKANNDPETAEGVNLDNLCSQNFITRLSATPTTLTARMTGLPGARVPAKSQINGVFVDVNFSLNNDFTFVANQCFNATLSIINSSASNFSVSINNTVISYTKQSNDETNKFILEILASLISSTSLPLKVSINADSNAIFIESINYINVSIPSGSGITILSVTNEANFTATKKGAFIASANLVNNILTPVSGWLAVNNKIAGKTGRNIESDAELRERREKSILIGGRASPGAIRARLLNIVGVTGVTVVDNYTSETVNGIPPKAFSCLVSGGDDYEIAMEIWRSKPVGIQPFGNTNIQIFDENGDTKNVGFSRATNLYIYVRLTLTKDNITYPNDGDNTIKSLIVEQIKKLEIGQDVNYQALYKSIYSVPGVNSALIELGSSEIDSSTLPSFSVNNISIGNTQVAETSFNKIIIL